MAFSKIHWRLKKALKYPVKLDGNLGEIETDYESLQCKSILRSSYQKLYAFLNAYFLVTNVSHYDHS